MEGDTYVKPLHVQMKNRRKKNQPLTRSNDRNEPLLLAKKIYEDVRSIAIGENDINVLMEVLNTYFYNSKTNLKQKEDIFKVTREFATLSKRIYSIKIYGLKECPELGYLQKLKALLKLSEIVWNIARSESDYQFMLTMRIMVINDKIEISDSTFPFVQWREIMFNEKMATHVQKIGEIQTPTRFNLHVPVLSHIVYIMYNYSRVMRELITELVINSIESIYILIFYGIEELSFSFISYIIDTFDTQIRVENLIKNELVLNLDSQSFKVEPFSEDFDCMKLSITIHF